MTPLKAAWMQLYTPITEHLKLDMRMNLKTKKASGSVAGASAARPRRGGAAAAEGSRGGLRGSRGRAGRRLKAMWRLRPGLDWLLPLCCIGAATLRCLAALVSGQIPAVQIRTHAG